MNPGALVAVGLAASAVLARHGSRSSRDDAEREADKLMNDLFGGGAPEPGPASAAEKPDRANRRGRDASDYARHGVMDDFGRIFDPSPGDLVDFVDINGEEIHGPANFRGKIGNTATIVWNGIQLAIPDTRLRPR